MSTPVTILMFGRDSHLLETRRMVLERCGYKVLTASELSDVDRALWLDRIDLLILCHSLSMEDCGRALAFAHSRWPRVKSLTLTAGASGCSDGFLNEVFDATEGPAKLVSKVNELAEVESQPHSHTY